MDVAGSQKNGLRAQLREFFYREEVPFSLALIRIILPLVLLAVVIPRWQHSRELFSTDGAAAPLAIGYGMQNFPVAPDGAVAVAMMTALAVSLVTSALGWFTRPSLMLAFGLYTYLNLLDCLSFMTKYSAIATHLLLMLSLSQCGSVWSIDAWRSGQKEPPKSAVWPQRLMALFIGLVYLGAATTKLHTNEYFTSEQLRTWLMTDVNNSNPLGEWLSFYPAVIIGMAHIAILWQLVFVFVVWRPKLRWIVLGLGVFFHASTTPLLGLYIFPLVMITSYLSFVTETDLRRFASWFRRRFLDRSSTRDAGPTRRPAPAAFTSGTAWLVVVLATTLTGVAAEQLLDPYDLRSESGPCELKPVSAELAEQIRRAPQLVAVEDRILSLDVGSELLLGVLVNSQSEFTYGDDVLVQVSLSPPHDDLWMVCCLLDETNREIHRSGQIVIRERLRADWRFSLSELTPPGRYSIVLHAEGREVARRPVTVKANSPDGAF